MNLLIINDLGIVGGGTEVRVKLLIEELMKRYFDEIHLLEHISSNSPNLNGLIIHKCETKNSYKITKNIILQNKIDLVQVHNLSLISVRPIISAKKLKKPVIFSAHDYWGFCGRRNKLFKNKKICKKTNLLRCSSCIGLISYVNTLKNKYYLNKCNIGIAPSEFVIQQYEKNDILKRKWRKIEPWIDLSKFYSDKRIKRDKSILFVGSLSFHKGADLIASALNEIRKKIPSIILRFVGDSQEKNDPNRIRIEQILKDNKITNNVEFLGYKNQDELRYEYCRAGVFIFCPTWPEVFGQVWAQAAACGCSVIATNAGSISELSDNLISLSAPNPQALAEKIFKVMNDKNKKKSLDLKRHVQKNFNINNKITQILNIYKSLTEDKNHDELV